MQSNEIPPTIKTVLVLEDNFIIAMDAEEILTSLGVAEVHVATNAEQAMEIANAHSIDFALIDVNLDNDTSFVVADAMIARGIMVGFTSGYGESFPWPEHLRDIPRIDKPFSEMTIGSLIEAAHGQRGG
ncbi:response regulator [Sinorhizobium terangae]|uniref:Response regulator n=1 Tax=Sinorhizobium terangae TaxID=110322 RepID=A0A6N7LF05_SINTE|nr:response regulator [Sinorhizobium terangae]MBB4188219.1 CheY-like chemotaxis protein [Sinorhizobium terangae]MQX16166.1 response regulator [Sinorhizobium terangae]WFU46764.1 response regulator [Sinorhizobium terangae]